MSKLAFVSAAAADNDDIGLIAETICLVLVYSESMVAYIRPQTLIFLRNYYADVLWTAELRVDDCSL